nr:reverse transcriptase domain-containing protein [Tanacetum cinerariifolium]
MGTDIVKLVVEIESFGMSSDDFDKEIVSIDELQLKQADLSYVHALKELHLHEIRVVPTNTIPRHSRRKSTNVVESEIRTKVTMADNRTMAQMLQATIEGYEDAIVVPNTRIKLLLFSFSLEGEARIWLDKEPPRSILTWEDLVSKFINQFFPPSKTTYLRNEIKIFLQKSNETFNKAWESFKDLLRQFPHHGFSELHQLDTFYNALNSNDQDDEN